MSRESDYLPLQAIRTDRSLDKEHMPVRIFMRFHDAGGISTRHKALRRFGETSVTPASSKGTCPAYASQFGYVSLPNIRQKIGVKGFELLRCFWLCVCFLKACLYVTISASIGQYL